MKPNILSSCFILLAVAACQQIESTARAVSLSVAPTSVSNLYAGVITLQVGGLLTGETVRIDKFLDANGNGVIDAADLPTQSFLLTDGQASVFYDGATAVTNINVPGDSNPTNGAITAQLSIASDIVQQIVAQYIFRLSSPTNRFAPTNILFNVINSAYAQSFTGAVQYAGANVPNVVVMVKLGNSHGSPFAGVMANNSGNYMLNLPVGTYSFYLFKSNYVANLSQSPVLTLTNGATFNTNLTFLIPATNSISGRLVDAANTNTGLPDVFMVCETPDRQLMAGACCTDTNGAFTVPVIAGQWEVSMANQDLGTYGYLGLNNNPQVDTTAGSVSGMTLALPKATALFYGFVTNSQGQPFAGLDISCQDNSGQYYQDYYTEANGYFVAPVVGGSANDGWQVQISSDNAPTNYIFPQPSFDQNGGTNLDAGQALLVNFTALLATNLITGSLTNNYGNPIAGVGVWANATINGVDYNQGDVDTDAYGNYSLNVANGTWYVGIETCTDCSDGLPGNYLGPPTQTVVISNNNGKAYFAALPATNHITGYLTNAVTGQGIANVGVPAWATINSVQYMQYARTDSNGFYSNNVANGTWSVNVNCGDCSDCLSSSLYLCPDPDSQVVIISNNNPVVDFAVQPVVPLQITTSNLPPGMVDNYYSQSLGAAGGQPPYYWSLPGGTNSLPPGLSPDEFFSSDANISGFPSTNSSYTFRVEVSDSASPPNTVTQLVSLTILSEGQPDVFDYYVMKLEAYLQVGPTNLVLNTNYGPFHTYVSVVQSAPDTVWFALVVLPTGAEVALPLGSSGLEVETKESFPTQAAMDAAYPPGNYTFWLDTLDDGTQSPVLTLPSAAYPNPPQLTVSNFAAAQAINPLSPFTLQWNAIPGATTSDFIWVHATDTNDNVVFSTPIPPIDPRDALNGTVTSVIIPTNTFQPGQAYTGWIILSQITSENTTEYPGVPGVTLVAAMTSFPLALASATPVVGQPARLSSNLFQFQLSGMADQNYTVQVSTNLGSTNWHTLLITNLSGSPVFIQDNRATNIQRFYRVMLGP
ncbi:MAG: hypothetical protein ABSD29_19290 [Verrucomicrobiota bacterium]|jgi:hypothetical protein